jgi:hypothetical protein
MNEKEFEISDEEIEAALAKPSPRANKKGDGGNLELWDDTADEEDSKSSGRA